MPAITNGWCGKILNVDLSKEQISDLNTMDYADRFLGGRGIATKLYWDLVSPEIGALDPENCLILMTGPLVGTGTQGASRFAVVGKSPMRVPEGFCHGNLGGFFGAYLKRAGYDGVVIRGKAEKPVYLWIDGGTVQIRDGAQLWGQGVYATAGKLKLAHGKQVRFVAIGPAGENLCRSATIMTDNEGSATGGWGAVLGSKNLKAIAVTGSGKPGVADAAGLQALNRQIVALNRKDPLWDPFPPDQVRRTGKGSCFQCGLDCLMRSRYQTASGREMVRKCQAMFVYFPWVMGRQGESAETALAATGLCNDYGLCTMEIYNIIRWLRACHKSGYLDSLDSGLDMSALGTLEFMETLTGMIAHRQGFGEILAQGLLRAGAKLGAQTREHFANEVSGVGDGATYSGREYPMNSLLYALEPRQPIAMLHEVSRIIGFWVMHQENPESSPVDSQAYRKATARFWGHPQAWDLNIPDGKAMAATRIIDRTIVKDSLGLCDSAWPLMFSWHTDDHVGDATMESRVFSAVTGQAMDEAGLNRFGERIFNLQRAILLREGWQPQSDDRPAEFNFTDPVQSVFMNPKVIVPGPGNEVISRQGKTLDREEYRTMRKEFYQLRGWDPASGLQTAATLKELQLQDLLKDLEEIQKIAE